MPAWSIIGDLTPHHLGAMASNFHGYFIKGLLKILISEFHHGYTLQFNAIKTHFIVCNA